jgi:nitrite reductase/ring-hydroxylating ferredoxin subunit
MSIMLNSSPSKESGHADQDNNAGCSQVTERPWQILAGLRPDGASFPARAKLEGEGIVVFRTQAGFRGVQRSCPHMQATMMNAELIANETMVRCPLHVYTFKLADGKGVNCPGFRLKVYEIKEENGALYGRSVN